VTIVLPSYEPPETTGDGAGVAAAGGCEAWLNPPPLLVALPDEAPALAAVPEEAPVLDDNVRPWNACEATSDRKPATASAAATSHRLIRDSRSKPALRAVEAFVDISTTVMAEPMKMPLKTA
jgi:hypothetical protein